jgi:hypothetical protein
MSENETPNEPAPADFAAQYSKLTAEESAHVERTVRTQTGAGGEYSQVRSNLSPSAEIKEWEAEMVHASEDRAAHVKAFEQRAILDAAGLPSSGPTKANLLTAALSAERRYQSAQKGRRRAVLAAEGASKRAEAHNAAEVLRTQGLWVAADLLEARAKLETDMSGNRAELRTRVYDLTKAAEREAAISA